MLVDENALNDLICMLDKSMVNQVRLAYIEDSQEKMQQLQQAWQAQDSSLIATISHSLKSSSSNIALSSLGRAFADIEAMAAKGQMDNLPDSLTPLQEMYDASIEQLNQHFETTTEPK